VNSRRFGLQGMLAAWDYVLHLPLDCLGKADREVFRELGLMISGGGEDVIAVERGYGSLYVSTQL